MCVAGSNPVASSPSTDNGIFLDTLRPAPCPGTLLAWNYCYYPKEAVNPANYSITVGVWALNGSDTQYRLLEPTLTTITVTLPQRNANQVPVIECGRQTIANGAEIAQGNVVGIIANSSSQTRLPILGQGSTGENSSLLNLQNLWNFRNVALHLFVEVRDSRIEATTLGPVDEAAILSVGVTVAISVVVVLLVVLVAAVFTLMLCLSWRSRRTSMATPSLKTYGTTFGIAG